MGHAIAVRTDFTSGEVRRFAKRAKDAAQARRLLAIAAVLDGASREDAAKIGGMDRQTLRDWVIRFNEQGPDGLINIPSPGVPPKLDDTTQTHLDSLIREGAREGDHFDFKRDLPAAWDNATKHEFLADVSAYTSLAAFRHASMMGCENALSSAPPAISRFKAAGL